MTNLQRERTIDGCRPRLMYVISPEITIGTATVARTNAAGRT